MTNWHEKPGAGWLIRLAGLVLIGISTLASMTLYQHVQMMQPHETSPVEFLLALLALLAFLACSAGSAMAVLGRHLFDRVQVSNRWMHHHSRRPDDGSKGWR